MPQYRNARIPFGDVLQAIETQLVADGVVVNAAQVAYGTPQNIPQFSGPFDVLLVARNGMHDGKDGGGAQLEMLRMVDVWYRSEAVADPGGGFKAWVRETFVKGDAIIASVGTDEFWPQDNLGNLLTVESIKLIGDSEPAYPTAGSVFGTYVATLSCLYMPSVDPARGVHPLP